MTQAANLAALGSNATSNGTISGSVIQVVNATYSTTTTSASATYANTGLSATITPKFVTSKILMIIDMAGCYKNANNTALGFQVLRNATLILTFEGLAGYNNLAQYNAIGSCSSNYLDSPGTTSATTYYVQFSNLAAVGTVGLCNVLSGAVPSSTITLMEIAQ